MNFFDQGYAPPEEGAFAIHVDGSPSPFGGEKHWLVRVGLQGREIASDARKDATLVFAIDVSGSMGREDRLGLVKRSLRLLVDELRPTDEVGIVIYGSVGQVLLEPTDGGEKRSIISAIDRLEPAAPPTRGRSAARLPTGRRARAARTGHARDPAVRRRGQRREHRPRLDTQAYQGVCRRGRYPDYGRIRHGQLQRRAHEQLANDGDGSYYYVDTINQARRVFVENLVGTLQNIAKDTKIQVDFNPEVVRSYRLLGYENRRVDDDDFRDDTVDAGEVGAGHSVTALYEMKLHEDADGVLGTVFLRYEDPDTGEVSEINREFPRSELATEFGESSPRFQMSAVVAEYAEILRESYWAQEGSLERVAAEAGRVQRLLPSDEDVAEFASLASRAESIQSQQ